MNGNSVLLALIQWDFSLIIGGCDQCNKPDFYSEFYWGAGEWLTNHLFSFFIIIYKKKLFDVFAC